MHGKPAGYACIWFLIIGWCFMAVAVLITGGYAVYVAFLKTP